MLVLSVSHSKFIIQTAMNTQRHLTNEQRHLAIARLRVGGRQSDVARELGVSQSVISRLASRQRTTGRVRDRPRSGAPWVTDHNGDQYLRTYALRHCYVTATQLQAQLRDVRGTRVSRQTIRNRFHSFGLNARWPLQVTPLPWTFAVGTRPCDLDNAAMVYRPVHWWVSGHLAQKWWSSPLLEKARLAIHRGQHGPQSSLLWRRCNSLGRHHQSAQNRFGYCRWLSHCTFLPQRHHRTHHHPPISPAHPQLSVHGW